MKDAVRSILAILLAVILAFFLIKETSYTKNSWGEMFVIFITFIGFGLSIYLFYTIFFFFFGIFDKKELFIRKLERKLPKSTKFKKTDDCVVASWQDGYKMYVYKFDFVKKTVTFSTFKESSIVKGVMGEGLSNV